MAMTTVITMLCLAGVAFNVRFLLALCNERKAPLNENVVQKRRGEQKQVARAA